MAGGTGRCQRDQIDASPGEVCGPPSNAHILSFILRGEARHRLWFDDHAITDGVLPDRSVAIVPAGIRPRAVSVEPILLTHVYLPHSYLSGKAAELGWHRRAGSLEIINPDYRPDEALISLCQCLSAALPAIDTLGRLYAESLAAALALRLLQNWSNVAPSAAPCVRGGLAPWQLRRACDMMESQPDQDIGLEMLASVAGVSPSHFSRAFKQSTGVPPFRWLLGRKVIRAKQLLLDPHKSLAEVALAVGFAAQP